MRDAAVEQERSSLAAGHGADVSGLEVQLSVAQEKVADAQELYIHLSEEKARLTDTLRATQARLAQAEASLAEAQAVQEKRRAAHATATQRLQAVLEDQANAARARHGLLQAELERTQAGHAEEVGRVRRSTWSPHAESH